MYVRACNLFKKQKEVAAEYHSCITNTPCCLVDLYYYYYNLYYSLLHCHYFTLVNQWQIPFWGWLLINDTLAARKSLSLLLLHSSPGVEKKENQADIWKSASCDVTRASFSALLKQMGAQSSRRLQTFLRLTLTLPSLFLSLFILHALFLSCCHCKDIPDRCGSSLDTSSSSNIYFSVSPRAVRGAALAPALGVTSHRDLHIVPCCVFIPSFHVIGENVEKKKNDCIPLFLFYIFLVCFTMICM